jgi:hypothetical protein
MVVVETVTDEVTEAEKSARRVPAGAASCWSWYRHIATGLVSRGCPESKTLDDPRAKSDWKPDDCVQKECYRAAGRAER